MKKLKLSEAKASLAEWIAMLHDGPVIVTDRGKPIAALVPIEGMDWETLSLGTNPEFLDLLEKSRRSLKENGGKTSDETYRIFDITPGASRNMNGRVRKHNRKKENTTTGKRIQTLKAKE